MISTLRLFRALPIKDRTKRKPEKALFEKTIQKGFIFAPEVVGNYPEKELFQLAEVIEKEIGLTPEQMNASFHKSWKKIKEADIEQLVLEQIVHYFTTYGFEFFGIYSPDSVYIPKEELKIPDIDMDNINFTAIRGYTKEEFKDKLLRLLSSGIALEKETIDDVVDVALWLELDEKDIKSIKNKEATVVLYDHLNIVPSDPVEFLRYIVYKSTEETLLIKSKEAIEAIKGNRNVGIVRLIANYKNRYGLGRLSEIFYRFKPIFLAFKTNQQLNTYVNKIRKLAIKHHKPMKVDYLNEITSRLKKGAPIDKDVLESELNRVNIFRKIRLAHALKFRTEDSNSILYKIRNGKSYAKRFDFNKQEEANGVLNSVLDSLIMDMRKKVHGKKIYIPEYMNYTLPATEKQFTGNFPSGSSVSLDGNMVFGINWKNIDNNRIDLDLSIMSVSGKIGWDAFYRDGDRNILFSGDITDASGKNGASELFYIKPKKDTALIVFVNYYNFNPNVKVPFKILVARKSNMTFNGKYMVDPNDVLSIANSTMDKRQKMLGIVIVQDGKCVFHFAEAYIGKSITASGKAYIDNTREYLLDYYRNSIKLEDVLKKAGAEMVKNKDKCDINLSPWELEKDSIINLLT
jgi:hypothetical protein